MNGKVREQARKAAEAVIAETVDTPTESKPDEIVNPTRDRLELKCHDDYKWAAMQIESLRDRVKELEDRLFAARGITREVIANE